MFAHGIEKSQLGEFGFDSLNIFTNDNIYCTGFSPTPEEVELVGQFISRLNQLSFSQTPISLYLTHQDGIYWIDLKTACMGEPLFADSQAGHFEEALCIVEEKVSRQIPQGFRNGYGALGLKGAVNC